MTRYNSPAGSGFGPYGGIQKITPAVGAPIGMASLSGGYLNSAPYALGNLNPGVYFPHSEDMEGRRVTDENNNILFTLNNVVESTYTTLTEPATAAQVNLDFKSEWITQTQAAALGIDHYAEMFVSNDALLLYGYNQASADYGFVISTDFGNTWTTLKTFSTGSIKDFGYNGTDQFVVLWSDYTINVSPDGENWASISESSITDAPASSGERGGLEYMGNRWIYVYNIGPTNGTANGGIITSPDGTSWSAQNGTIGLAYKNFMSYYDSTNDQYWLACTSVDNASYSSNMGVQLLVGEFDNEDIWRSSYMSSLIPTANYEGTRPIAFGGTDGNLLLFSYYQRNNNPNYVYGFKNISWLGYGNNISYVSVNSGAGHPWRDWQTSDRPAPIGNSNRNTNYIAPINADNNYLIMDDLYVTESSSGYCTALPAFASLTDRTLAPTNGTQMWNSSIAGVLSNGDIIVNAKLRGGSSTDYAIWKTQDFSEQGNTGAFNLFTTSHTTLN